MSEAATTNETAAPASTANGNEATHGRPPVALAVRGLTKLYGRRAGKALAAAPRDETRAEWLAKRKIACTLDDITFDVPSGSVTAIAGATGSGKSTLLMLLGRLIEPTAGQIIHDGQDICTLSRRQARRFRRDTIATAFQSGALIPHLTAFDNILYPLQIRAPLSKGARQRARDWMAAFGVAHLEERYPGEMHVSDRIRIGLVRALVADRPLILLDEPFALIPPAAAHRLRKLVLDHAVSARKTLVLTTGDVTEALEIASHVVLLGGGRVAQAGSPETILLQPSNDDVRAWTADANRARLVTVRAVMEPLEQSSHARGPAIAGDASLAEAARIMTEAGSNFAHVNGGNGEPVAALTLARVVAAMQPPQATTPEQPVAIS